MLERWCCFFKYASQIALSDLKKMGNHPILEEAYQALDQHYWTEAEYVAYEREFKRIRDHKAMLEAAEDTGVQKGLQQGRQEGLEREQRKVFEIARNMLVAGVAPEIVQQTTQLSDKDIAELLGD